MKIAQKSNMGATVAYTVSSSEAGNDSGPPQPRAAAAAPEQHKSLTDPRVPSTPAEASLSLPAAGSPSGQHGIRTRFS